MNLTDPLLAEAYARTLQDALARAVRAEAKARIRFERAEKCWRACQRRTREALRAVQAAGKP